LSGTTSGRLRYFRPDMKVHIMDPSLMIPRAKLTPSVLRRKLLSA
jgi:hypothetical protein